jgi:hypothetical protein
MPLDDTNWSPPTEAIDETTALLVRARGFIERGWCRHALARDSVVSRRPGRHPSPGITEPG